MDIIYGLQRLWGSAKKSNSNEIQVFQNIIHRNITNAPFYVSNSTLRQDLGIRPVITEAKLFYKRYFVILENHPSPLIKKLLRTFSLSGYPQRRLKWKRSRDHLN